MSCQSTEECQQRWWRVSNWLDSHAKFKVKAQGEHRLVAKARTPAHKNRLEYTVSKEQRIEGGWVFSAQASCRSSVGCPSAENKLKEMSDYVMQPLSQDMTDDEQHKLAENRGPSPIQSYVQTQACTEPSQTHHLRTSWAGQLYEIECFRKGKDHPVALVVRCRAEQCHVLD